MVGLVLEAAGEEAGALDPDGVAVLVQAGHGGVVGPGEVLVRGRDGEAALRRVVQGAAAGRQLLQDGVDDVADVAHAVVVGAVVDEDLEVDADLVGRQADTLRRVHRDEHVVHEGGEFGVEGGDVPALVVQDGVADHGDRPGGALREVRLLADDLQLRGLVLLVVVRVLVGHASVPLPWMRPVDGSRVRPLRGPRPLRGAAQQTSSRSR
ncbi:hypothetical protein GCM10025734_53320 [Kitasatospora paranensis]